MVLSATALCRLGGLLDEALDLEPDRLELWLAALPPEDACLQARLRAAFGRRRGDGEDSFLRSLPGLATAEPDAAVAHAEDRVGPYRLIRELGRGGMGMVWLAERDGETRRFALKLPQLAWGAGLAGRMARERAIGARLAHPHIAALHDAGVDAQGRPYLAFEHIEGEPLDRWCTARALSVPGRLRLFLQVAGAVAHAHARGVVHRDLKPANVLVDADGQAHLLDFGIAKLLEGVDGSAEGDDQLTREHGRVLTPHYASPEQIRDEPVTVASDVYSLGVLLHRLLTGRYPHQPERSTLGALEESILYGEPVPASRRCDDPALARQLRGELDAILARAMQREPDQRYASADAFGSDVERHLQGGPVLARPRRLHQWIDLGRTGLARRPVALA